MRESGSECVISDVIPISDTGEEFTDPQFGWNLWHAKNRRRYFEADDIYAGFLQGNLMVTTSNLFMTSKAARTVGTFCDLRYLHDYDYIFRMLLAFPKKVQYLADEKLLYYRIHPGNTLGEAAVIGRRQDQQLIKKYMAARVPEELRKTILAGAERLIELGDELHQVSSAIVPEEAQGVRPALGNLLESLGIWGRKKIGRDR
jgi:hypothetical protein